MWAATIHQHLQFSVLPCHHPFADIILVHVLENSYKNLRKYLVRQFCPQK